MIDRKFTILVAEDNPNDLKLFYLALRRNPRPVEVRDVKDGIDVGRYLKGETPFEDRKAYPLPDLIIVDLKMPRMSGLEVVKWLRAEPRFARIPLLMLSGSGQEKDVAEAYRLGANSYFQKPSDFADFAHKLGIMIDYWMITERPRSG